MNVLTASLVATTVSNAVRNEAIASLIATIVIGLVTVYIAYQQWRTNRNQLRLHLFDRRWEVYKATMTLPDIIVTKGNITNEELWRYASATRGARFLFDKETQDYCDKLREEAVAVQVLRQIIDRPSSIFEFDFLMDEPHRSNEEAWSNRKQWFIAQVDEIPKQFAPFLQLIG